MTGGLPSGGGATLVLGDSSGNASWSTNHMFFQSQTITSSQLLNLRASPVQLLPAPGSNKFYRVINCVAMLKFGTTPYTTTGAVLAGTYGINGSLAWTNMNTFMAGGSNFITIKLGSQIGVSGTVLNQPIYLCNTGGSDLQSGDSSITIQLYYTISTFTS